MQTSLMPYRRRQFLLQLGALFGVPASLAISTREAKPELPWLAFRPAAFDVTTDSASIWLCADGERSARIQYSAAGQWDRSTLSELATLSQSADYTASVRLKGLAADTRYQYRIADADGKPRDADFASGSFATAPSAHRDFTFAFSADTHARHRPFKLFDLMLEKKPDFFIHLGDTVYADSPRSQFQPTLEHYRKKHREIRSDSHLQRFLSEVPTFVIWDDHEVENDFTGSHPAIAIGRQAFLEYWPVAGATHGDATILYRRFQWTPACEFFILDTRQYRDAGDSGPGIGKTMLGSRQLEWLKRGLKASSAQFKFVCSSVPFHQNGVDKWGGFKAERRHLVEFIRDERIRNVVILSADLHAAADLSDERTGLVEFLIGPIAAPLQQANAPSSRTRDSARAGSYVGDEYNFGLIRVAHPGGVDGRATLRHEVIDARNSVRYSREIVATG